MYYLESERAEVGFPQLKSRLGELSHRVSGARLSGALEFHEPKKQQGCRVELWIGSGLLGLVGLAACALIALYALSPTEPLMDARSASRLIGPELAADVIWVAEGVNE